MGTIVAFRLQFKGLKLSSHSSHRIHVIINRVVENIYIFFFKVNRVLEKIYIIFSRLTEFWRTSTFFFSRFA